MANELVDYVSSQISEMQTNQGLQLPENYSVSNALNAAYLMLTDDSKGPSFVKKMNDNQISKRSVLQALTNMVIQGLSPSKTQGYFIQYGRSLTFSRSYFGSVAIVARQPNVAVDPFANVVREGDEFEIGAKDDRIVVTKYKPNVASLDNPIVAAYAVIEFKDGHKEYTIMSKKQIDTAWSHRKNKGQVQQEFPEEMAKRTVLNRAAKYVINTSSDSDLLVKAINDTTNSEYDYGERKDVTPNQPESIKDLLVEEEQQQIESKESIEPEEPAQGENTVLDSEELAREIDENAKPGTNGIAEDQAEQQQLL